jgi:hypothetical protein
MGKGSAVARDLSVARCIYLFEGREGVARWVYQKEENGWARYPAKMHVFRAADSFIDREIDLDS